MDGYCIRWPVLAYNACPAHLASACSSVGFTWALLACITSHRGAHLPLPGVAADHTDRSQLVEEFHDYGKRDSLDFEKGGKGLSLVLKPIVG